MLGKLKDRHSQNIEMKSQWLLYLFLIISSLIHRSHGISASGNTMYSGKRELQVCLQHQKKRLVSISDTKWDAITIYGFDMAYKNISTLSLLRYTLLAKKLNGHLEINQRKCHVTSCLKS